MPPKTSQNGFIDGNKYPRKKNGATCFDGNVIGSTKFKCNCIFPFAGERCKINLCDAADCENGGTCVQAPGGIVAAKCECPENTTGDKCQHLSCGNSVPCYNGGTCNDGICECSQENGNPKYHGQSCDMPAACDGNPCQNGGLCTEKAQINNTQGCFKFRSKFRAF